VILPTFHPKTSTQPLGDMNILPWLLCQEVCGRPFSRQEAILMAKGEMDPRTRQPKRLEALTNAERRAIDLMLADKRSEQSDYRHQVALEDWILFVLDQSVCGVCANVEKTSMHHCITVRLVF